MASIMRRRDFLILGGCAVPSFRSLEAQSAPSARREFQTPLDATLLKTKAGLDDFITEKYHDQIAAILAEWRFDLPESIAMALAPGFRGASPQPSESRILRPGPALEIRDITFSQQISLGREAFIQELRSSFSSFSKIETADLQVTRIDALP